jgi:hypothetical protein
MGSCRHATSASTTLPLFEARGSLGESQTGTQKAASINEWELAT